MPQSDEQTEQTTDFPKPAPSIQNRLAPSHEYVDKVFRRFHHHTISDSSVTGSNDSSPTTTISTVDDSSATETSPGSSPESPPPSNFAVGMLRPRTADDARPFFELQKHPPPRKGRNLKNLAVNTSRNGPGSSSSLPLPTSNAENINSDASPAFVKPPTPSKRKPSNLGLTLLTPGLSPGSNKAPPQEITLNIPPTPGFSRPGALRHFQSSPSLPLFTKFGSDIQDVSRATRVTSLETILSPALPEPKSCEEEAEQNFDVPLSQEEKPEAYPDGPICVYDPHIDLYLEPTVEQAREYDVIMNVASEVRNPFVESSEPVGAEPDIRIDGGGGIQYAPKRDRAALKEEAELPRGSSQTTPMASPLHTNFPANDRESGSDNEPEYIHVKWEHNSDIVPDLLALVKLIDDKVIQRKRVLIHCQCGVSRSASLVVAYGLYKDPNLSVQEAYDAVKKRSKWIGPNMNLIMQLQEFRTSLMHGGLLPSNRGMTPITPNSAFGEWKAPYAANSTGPNASQPLGSTLNTAKSLESLPALMSGPSSAPSSITRPLTNQAPGQRARAVSAVKPGTPYVNPSGRIVPVLNVVEPDSNHLTPATAAKTHFEQNREESNSTTPTELVRKASTEEFAMTPLQPSPDVDAADSFGLMSPSTTEFSTSPFDRSALLAQLGFGPIGQQEDLAPRRSLSIRNKRQSQLTDDQALVNEPKQLSRLRNKISSPNLREQEQLQAFQAQIQASLPQRGAPISFNDESDEPLMSPRATEFTENPFALALSGSTMSTPSEAPKTPGADPRSPAQKGGSPITRSIFDVL